MRFWNVVRYTALLISVVAEEILRADIGLYEMHEKNRLPAFFRTTYQYDDAGRLKTELSSNAWLYEIVKDNGKPLTLIIDTTCTEGVKTRISIMSTKQVVSDRLFMYCAFANDTKVNTYNFDVDNGQQHSDMVRDENNPCRVTYKVHDNYTEIEPGDDKTKSTGRYRVNRSPQFRVTKRRGAPEANVISLHVRLEGTPPSNCDTTMTFGKDHYVLLYKAVKKKEKGGTTTTVGGVTTTITTADTTIVTTETSVANSNMLDFSSSGTILWAMLFTLCGLTSLSVGSVCMFFILHCIAKRQKNKAVAEDEDVHAGIDRDSAILPVIAPPYAPEPEKNQSVSVKNASVSRQTSLTSGSAIP
uniref:M120.1 protein n=1 Tax=Panagrellus redivivus TaxID=6233 RepID=A0A7E4UQJ2_PANRE